jgi:hypothetical protein
MAAGEYENVNEVKRRNRDRLMAPANVVGVGIGPKIVAGEESGRLVIRVYVRKKVPAEVLDAGQRIPAEVEGVPTDVVEVGEVRLHGEDNGS